jgi:hypothetical protein
VHVPVCASNLLADFIIRLMKPVAIAVLGLLASGATASLAQSPADFVSAFSGKWQVYEQRMASGQAPCTLELSALAGDAKMPLTSNGCAAPLNTAANWAIEGNQLVFRDGQNQPVATLGGNQRRVTGTTPDGTPIILERAGGDGTSTTLQAAYNASGCYYLGYTQSCAPRAQLREPAAAPDGRIRIQMETNLMAHAEPRADAQTIGTVQQGTCVVVDACTMASDGPWCRAQFGSEAGWLRKFTLRQNRWPVITFTNACQ